MTISTFSTEIVPILQLVVSALGVVTIILLWYQIRLTNIWNKANTQHQLLSELPSEDLENRFLCEFESLEKDRSGNITEAAAREIFIDINKKVCVKTFLNKYEHICAAINSKTIDDSYAYSVHSDQVNSAYFKMENFISLARTEANDIEIYIELQKVAMRWKEKYLNNFEERKQEIMRLDHRLSKSNGAKKLVP